MCTLTWAACVGASAGDAVGAAARNRSREGGNRPPFSTTRAATARAAKVEIPSGINNGITLNQDGAGNHYAGIQNLSGTANNITVGQSGAGNHTMAISGATGTTNNGNTITAEQSGGAGADKSFQLNLNGTAGATVNIQQTNPTTPNTGSMTIQCVTCGTYNYTRQ